MSKGIVVSTIIPTRNRAELLPGAVHSALAQQDVNGKLIPQEIIIVDDNSTDNTPAVATTLMRENSGRIQYLQVCTGTPGGTRNAGARSAHGQYLAFLDDDDVWMSGRLAKALAIFSETPTVAFVYGQVTPTDAVLQPADDPRRDFPALPLPQGHPIAAFLASPPHLNATLFKREVFDEVGGFDHSLSGFEDVDLLIRIARLYPCATVQEPLSLMRFHTDGLNNAVKTWQRYQDETRARRFHLSVRDLYRPGVIERIRLTLRYRGWYVHRFLQGIARAKQSEDVRIAIRYALRVSPLHALKSPLLWRALQMKGVSQ